MDPNRDMMNSIYQMTKENNEMLHSMRRSAFITGLVKFVFYIALIVVPIWFYLTYLNDGVQKTLTVFNQLQASGVSVQNFFKQFEPKIPGFGGTASSTK